MYKLIGKNRYQKDGKFVKSDSVPEAWRRILDRRDIFTGEAANHGRMVDGMMVYLSDESYYAKTYGAVVAQYRKLIGETNGPN